MYLPDPEKMKHTEAEKLFLEKMAVLNKTFLHFIQCSLKEMPDADLSPCVLDYLKHVEELDRTYGGMLNGDGANSSTENDEKSQVTLELPKKNLSEKDACDEKERGRDVGDTSSTQEKPESRTSVVFGVNTNRADVLKFSSDLSTTSSVGSEKRGRKRAKKGGPEGNDEEVIISNHNAPSSQESTNSEYTKTTPCPISQSSSLSSFFNNSAAGSILNKSYDGGDDSKTATDDGSLQKKMYDVKEASVDKVPLFLFSRKDDSEENEIQKDPRNSVTTKSFPEKKMAGELEQKKEPNDKFTGKPYVTPAFSFLKPVAAEGNSGCTGFSKAKLVEPHLFSDFNFGAPPTVHSEPDNESEECEYIPPKPEAVLVEEPKSIFSSKCSVFVLKGTEYEKLGIGQLHIKTDETDGVRKILLIRAATTTGAVWVNSYVDESMKYVNIEDVKLRISCVSNGTPATYLLRLPKKEDRDQIVAEIQGDSISS